MEVLASRLLLRPRDLERSLAFYRDALGLPVYREFGAGRQYGVVFFTGGGYLEVAGELGGGATAAHGNGPGAGPGGEPAAAGGHATAGAAGGPMLWLQVRDAPAELARLAAAGVPAVREARREPWGLVEGWIEDPDGMRICVVEVPEDHPIRRRVD